VAWGKIVDDAALVAARPGRQIACAAPDVFETEPPVPDNPLRQMENVILGTHNAYNEDEPVGGVTRNTIRRLIEGLER
jgi:phosphoglycerate dehydrogenase-like enzyme